MRCINPDWLCAHSFNGECEAEWREDMCEDMKDVIDQEHDLPDEEEFN